MLGGLGVGLLWAACLRRVAVMHPQYGIGRIVAIHGNGPNRKGRVAFTIGGEKTFVLAKSPLKPMKSR